MCKSTITLPYACTVWRGVVDKGADPFPPSIVSFMSGNDGVVDDTRVYHGWKCDRLERTITSSSGIVVQFYNTAPYAQTAGDRMRSVYATFSAATHDDLIVFLACQFGVDFAQRQTIIRDMVYTVR